MTFETALSGLTDELTVLVSGGGAVPNEERPAALVALDAVVAMVGDVYRDLAPIAVVASPKDPLGLAATHPVALLRGQLIRLPAPFADSPPVVSSPAGRAWMSTGRHASVAQHDWARTDPASRPAGDARWTLLGHLAAVIEAVAILDNDLGTAGPPPGLPIGLRVAAERVRLLASRGPQPPVPPVVPRPDRRPVRVRAAGHVPPAQHRLATLLNPASHVTPADIVRISTGQGRVLLAVASALRSGGQKATGTGTGVDVLAARLVEVAGALPNAGSTGGVATIEPGDPRPLAQCAEINRFLADHPHALAGAGRATVLTTAGATLLALRAVTAITELHLSAGRWMVPDPRLPQLTWERSSRPDPADPPRLLTAVRQASRLGDELLDLPVLAAPPADPSRAWPARTGLPAAVDLRTRRPLDPARRPDQRPPRR